MNRNQKGNLKGNLKVSLKVSPKVSLKESRKVNQKESLKMGKNCRNVKKEKAPEGKAKEEKKGMTLLAYLLWVAKNVNQKKIWEEQMRLQKWSVKPVIWTGWMKSLPIVLAD